MFWLFCLLLFQLFSAEHKVSETEEKCYFGFDSGKKCQFQIESGGLFHDINLKNNSAIVIFRFSTTCG